MESDEGTTKNTRPEIRTSREGLRWAERAPLYDGPFGATCGAGRRPTVALRKGRLCRDSEDMLLKAKRKVLVMTALYKELGFSGYRGVKCKEELVKGGYAEEVELPTNRRGRRQKLLQVTPKGNEYLKELGISLESRGKGGVKHLWYQQKLVEYYRGCGYTAEIEAQVGGASLDLLVIAGEGTRIGVEVALSAQYEPTKARMALEGGVDRLLFVAETTAVLEKLRERLASVPGEAGRGELGFKLVGEYLKEE